ncbi:MAG: 6,7-dimethyl-8-ribityllumazine synthase [Actinobacteria bacterium]|nr:6,7-dimethyl-8-ribityllumazine synthase [Actinomycetota bacterium]
MRIVEATLDGSGLRIGIVVTRFNDTVTRRLLDGAVDSLRRHHVGDDDITVAWVPGGWELPVVVRRMVDSGHVDAVIALAAVVRGQTAHFDYVAGNAATVGQAAIDTGVPVSFGVLTTETWEQAVDRAGGKRGNAGADAALAAIETARVLEALSKPGQAGASWRAGDAGSA